MGCIYLMLIQLIREDASQEAFCKSFVVFIKVRICFIYAPQHDIYQANKRNTENRVIKEIASTDSSEFLIKVKVMILKCQEILGDTHYSIHICIAWLHSRKMMAMRDSKSEN